MRSGEHCFECCSSPPTQLSSILSSRIYWFDGGGPMVQWREVRDVNGRDEKRAEEREII